MSEMHIQPVPSMKPLSFAGAAISNSGRVQVGGCAPSLPPVRISSDATATGKVRVGGCAPSLPR